MVLWYDKRYHHEGISQFNIISTTGVRLGLLKESVLLD